MKFKRTVKKETRLLKNKWSIFYEDERCRKIMEAFVDKEVEVEIQDLTIRCRTLVTLVVS